MPQRTYRFRLLALIIIMMGARLLLSLQLLSHFHGLYTLSADDVARCRIALLWAEQPSFFPDSTWPPLPFWLGGVLAYFGAGLYCMGVVSILSSIMTVPLIAFLSNDWLKQIRCSYAMRLVAIAFPLLIFCVTPRWLKLGSSMLAEPLYIFLMLLTLACLWVALTRNLLCFGFIALLAALCATLTRYEGIVLILMVWGMLLFQFRRRPLMQLMSLVLFGAVCFLFFPTVWLAGKAHEAGGVVEYFERLREGFTSKQGGGLFHAPILLLKQYVLLYPTYWALMLAGAIGVFLKRNLLEKKQVFIFYFIALAMYVAFQFLASIFGMMPSHTFWRLIVPVYIAGLPFISIAISQWRFICVPIAAFVLVWMIAFSVPVIHKQHVYLTDELYQIGEALANKARHAEGEDAPLTFLEVSGWDWLGIGLISGDAAINHFVYDKDRYAPYGAGGIVNDENPNQRLNDILTNKQIELAVVESDVALKFFEEENWERINQIGKYQIFLRPME